MKQLEGKKLFIFDFDGTVADTSPLHAQAFEQILAPFGVTVDYPSIAGLKTADALTKLLKDSPADLASIDLQALTEAKQAIVRKLISTSLSTLPGVEEFLRWAKPRYQISMATSGSRGTVLLSLDRLGLTGWFDPLVCADDVANAKPAPDLFLEVLRITGHSADATLVFEDSDSGALAARKAGIACCDVRLQPWMRLLDEHCSRTA